MIAGGLERLLRYERGELSPAEAASLQADVNADAEARAWLEWIKAVRGTSSAATAGTDSCPLPDPIEIAALAQGSLERDRAAELRRQLGTHPDGFALFEAAVEEVSELQATIATQLAPRPRGRLFRFPGAWLAAAAAVLIAVGVWMRQDPSAVDYGSLALREPLTAPVLRNDQGGSAAYARGLEHYRESDWEQAIAELESAVAAQPDLGVGWLYLGSARLQLGLDAAAAAAFEEAVLHCEGTFADEARWQSVQALLATEAADAAAERLSALAADGGHRTRDAETLIAELEDLRRDP